MVRAADDTTNFGYRISDFEFYRKDAKGREQRAWREGQRMVDPQIINQRSRSGGGHRMNVVIIDKVAHQKGILFTFDKNGQQFKMLFLNHAMDR